MWSGYVPEKGNVARNELKGHTGNHLRKEEFGLCTLFSLSASASLFLTTQAESLFLSKIGGALGIGLFALRDFQKGFFPRLSIFCSS